MGEKFLWKLVAIDTTFDDSSFTVAETEKEANEKWESLYGDEGYLGGSVTKIDIVDGFEIFVKEKV
jgi:hypothetical protein